MPPRNTQIIESFAYEGALDWTTAMGVFAGVTALVAWLLWRERKITGPATASLFFVLRVIAIGVVLWMLLGPTHVATQRTTIPQTLAIIVDSSESMNVAEPMPEIDQLRWQQAVADRSPICPELVDVDAALVALRHAAGTFRQAVEAANEFAANKELVRMLAAVQKSALAAVEHLAAIEQTLKSTDQELSRQASEAGQAVRQEIAEPIDKLSAAVGDSATADVIAFDDKLIDDLDRALRRVESLERRVVARALETSSVAAAGARPPVSRRQLAAETLQRVEAGDLRELSKTVNIKRVRVDRHAAPVSADKSWLEATQPVSAPAGDGLASKPQGTPPAESSTNLTAALEMLSEDAAAESIAAAVLFSDGGHNSPGTTEPAAVAAGLSGLRVHVVPVGSQEPQRDLLLYRVDAPSSVTLNDKIVLEALVTGQYLSGETVTVELRREGQLIEKRQLTFDSDRQDHRLRFSAAADRLGQHVFDLMATPLADELSSTNNAAVVSVRVVRDTTRVLLADRISRWEYRYLDQLFRRDKHVEFEKLLYAPNLVATGKLETAKELPRDVAGWSAYDVVILGDLDPKTFDAQQQASLEEWVRKRGGNAIFIAGAEYMPHQFGRGPLSGLLPVQESPRLALDRNGYLPSFTADGMRHEALLLAERQAENSALWATQFRMVPIYFLSSFCTAKPAAHVLIEAAAADGFAADGLAGEAAGGNRAGGPALLSWHDVGAGRVVFIAAPVTYHMRFRRGDELHHKFWGQMLRWLTAPARGKGENQLLVKTANSRYDYGQPIEVTASLASDNGSPIKGAEVTAIAEPSTGERVSIPLTPDENVPGRYLGKFDKLPPGAYRISAGGEVAEAISAAHPQSEGATALVSVYAPDNIELNNTRGNRALLREIAEITGGQVLPPTAVGEILKLSALAPRVTEESVRTPLWNRWRYLWIVVGCLVAEWGCRRWIGLV